MSIRALAVSMLPESHTPRQLDNMRGQIHKWLKGQAPTDANAERLAAALDYPVDYFKTARPERAAAGLTLAGLAQALARLEASVDLLEKLVEDQERRLDQLEQQPARKERRPAGGAARR